MEWHDLEIGGRGRSRLLKMAPFDIIHDLLHIEMHDGIFHFEILKKNHENFEIFQDSFFEIFHEIFNFQY